MIHAFDWDYKFCLHCVYLKHLDFEIWQWQDHSEICLVMDDTVLLLMEQLMGGGWGWLKPNMELELNLYMD